MGLKENNRGELDERQIFQINVEAMQRAYPHRNIELEHTFDGDIVVIDGEQMFNTGGYCLLYNLQRLVKCLEKELL